MNSSEGWRKATASGDNGSCVELRRLTNGMIGLRDSKNPEGPHHEFTPVELACFLDGAKKGEFDDLAG
jgi:hypothetical protein